MAFPLVDIGVNLDNSKFDHDRSQVIARAVSAGVGQMVLTGATLKSSQAALKLAQSRPGQLYSTAGVHPNNARDWNNAVADAIRQLAAHPEVVSLGECGLDFNRDFSPRPDQEKCFAAQIELAIELNKPLFLHERDAHARFMDILSSYRSQLGPVVVHCFTGQAAELDAYLALDLHIGITGWICDERRGQHLQHLVKRIPLDRLMLETDAPYLLPRTIQPRPKDGRNEPSYLPYVLETVAASLGQPAETVAAATTATAQKFFGLK